MLYPGILQLQDDIPYEKDFSLISMVSHISTEQIPESDGFF
jgi:hypothetical protein